MSKATTAYVAGLRKGVDLADPNAVIDDMLQCADDMELGYCFRVFRVQGLEEVPPGELRPVPGDVYIITDAYWSL